MATIKGKWQFTNDAMRIKDHPVHYCEQAVNFTAATAIQCTSITFNYSETDLTVNILFYIPEIAMTHFIVNSSTGAIADAAYAQVDFGNTPQKVSDDFLDLMNLVAVPTNDDWTVTLNGKYVVSPAGIGKIFTNYDLNSNYGPPTWYTIYFTNTIPGSGYSCLSCYNSLGLGDAELYFGDSTQNYDTWVDVNTGFQHANGFQIIDFGQQNQTIDAIFYGEVLRYALTPIGNEFVDETGSLTFANELSNQINTQVKQAIEAALPSIVPILAYNASSDVTTYTFSNGSAYDTLFLCVTPGSGSDLIFLTVAVNNIAYSTAIQIDAPDNVLTTRYQIYRYPDDRLEVKAVACYNQSAVSQSITGRIRGIYGLKIGG